mgnify:CR=1 FL=1
MKTVILTLFTLLYAAVPSSWVKSNGPGEVTYRIHSIFIWNFIKEIQWPANAGSGEFTIGLLANADMETELSKILTSTRTTTSRKITLKVYRSIAEVNKNCHILYLDAENSDNLSTALQKVKGAPVLVITHKDGAARFGSLINFVTENGKPRFEMNLSAFEKNGLKYTQTLKAASIPLN